MYKKIEDILSREPVDYWYDEAVDLAREAISQFTQNDWDKLEKSIERHENTWISELVYLLGPLNYMLKWNGLKIYLKVLKTDDINILIRCMNSLCDFNTNVYRDSQEINKFIEGKINYLKASKDTHSFNNMYDIMLDKMNRTKKGYKKKYIERKSILKKIKECIEKEEDMISKYDGLRDIIPPYFYKDVNKLLNNYTKLSQEEFYYKIPFYSEDMDTLEQYIQSAKQNNHFGKVLIHYLTKIEYILQLDEQDDFKYYNPENFWGEEPVNLKKFDIGDNKYYFAYIPQSTTLEDILSIKIEDVPIGLLNNR